MTCILGENNFVCKNVWLESDNCIVGLSVKREVSGRFFFVFAEIPSWTTMCFQTSVL